MPFKILKDTVWSPLYIYMVTMAMVTAVHGHHGDHDYYGDQFNSLLYV